MLSGAWKLIQETTCQSASTMKERALVVLQVVGVSMSLKKITATAFAVLLVCLSFFLTKNNMEKIVFNLHTFDLQSALCTSTHQTLMEIS